MFEHVGGSPLFALRGQRIVVRGVVTPYVGGQTVKVSLYRDGRKVEVKIVSVLPIGNGAGLLHINYASGSLGLVQAHAAHYATAQQVAFSSRSPSVRFVTANLGPGAKGPSVGLLQSELNALHYVVPLDGVFDEATGRAVIAYRKLTGLARVASINTHVFELLQRGRAAFTCAIAATAGTSRRT